MTPCKHCGVSDRYAAGNCRPCGIARAKFRKTNIPAHVLAKPCVRCGAIDRRKNGTCRPCDAVRFRITLLRRYGLSPRDFERMLAEQSNRCAVCGDLMRPGLGTTIDHDHVTGVVRGLLCPNCNAAEGHLKGSALRAEKLAAYMRLHAPKLRFA